MFSPLKQALDFYLKDHPLASSLKSLSKAHSALSNSYRSLSQAEKNSFKAPLKEKASRLAYLLARMPATYEVIAKILAEIPRPPSSLLDLGSGTGAGLWAAHLNFSLKQITAIDQEKGLLSLAKVLISYDSSFPEISFLQKDLLKSSLDEIAPHQLTLLSYILIECPEAAKIPLLDKAFQKTEDFLVLIEPGTPEGYKNCLLARTHFIKQGASILAPCSHQGPCPIKGKDWCHFSCRLQRTSEHRALKEGTLGFEDEKYSYLIVSRNPAPHSTSRILRPPLKRSGHIIFDLCAPKEIKRVTLSKESFKKYRHKKWGDTLEKQKAPLNKPQEP